MWTLDIMHIYSNCKGSNCINSNCTNNIYSSKELVKVTAVDMGPVVPMGTRVKVLPDT
jgi:hypothetical protein